MKNKKEIKESNVHFAVGNSINLNVHKSIFLIAESMNKLDEAIENYTGERIKGGLSDAKKVTDYSIDAIRKGIKVELEHTDDINIALEIVMDHLFEDEKYYDKIETIEKQ